MNYIDEFRDGALAQQLAQTIRNEADPARRYVFMEFCGGHTHAISRYGISDLLPANVRMIHGPGCPICVLPVGRIDQAIELALEKNIILCTYGDALRVPASNGLSLQKAKARGADIRMLFSCADALALARANPEREVVFLAIGFETTTPPTAFVIKKAQALAIDNFSVLSNHVLTPAAMHAILNSSGLENTVILDGIIGPAHVSTIIGSRPYETVAATHRKPIVIAGFEPLDVMQAIRMLISQVNEGRAVVENEFTRAVSRDGNLKAQALVAEVFRVRPAFAWRGLGTLPQSALMIQPSLTHFDAEKRFTLQDRVIADHPGCACGAILRGHQQPAECKLFANVCTPEHPVGACMVSSEGACAACYTFERFNLKTYTTM